MNNNTNAEKSITNEQSSTVNGGTQTIHAEKNKFCKFCGAKITEDAVMCILCGRQVEELKQANPTAIPNIVINNENSNANTNVNQIGNAAVANARNK